MLLRRKTRRAGAAAISAGFLGIVIALFWPASEKKAIGTTKLDQVMPVWEFDERHEVEVAASPEKIFAAIREVRADEIKILQYADRDPKGWAGRAEDILNPGKRAPILDVALRSGFSVMADDSPREIVFGTTVIRPNRAIATMNFLVVSNGATSRLITETRIHATDDAARRRFAVYWRIIHPGSDIIRRAWLDAIRKRAESAHSL